MTAPMDTPPSVPQFLSTFGARFERRAEPRAAIAVAGAGCALAVLGVLAISGDNSGTAEDFNRVPGLLLSGLVIAAGYVLLATMRSGALATAGTVASTLGIPAFLVFLTIDADSLPPYNTEVILLGTTLAWLASWAVSPGRGRPLYLGAGLIGLWASILQLTEKVFDFPFGLFGFFGGFAEPVDPTFDDPGGFEDPGSFGFQVDTPDPTTLGIISLLFGIGYLLVGRRLDRAGRFGGGTPFAVAVLPALVAAVGFLADDLEQAGSGLLTLLLGAGLALHGATVGRRLTTWVGGGAVALGAAIFLGDMTDDVTVGGMLFLAAGIGLVAAGHAVGTLLGEQDEMLPGVSTFATRPAGPGSDGGLPPSPRDPPPSDPGPRPHPQAPSDPTEPSPWAPPPTEPPTFEPPAPPPPRPGDDQPFPPPPPPPQRPS